ncbi:MAG TPA: endonuclease, partial [Spartobacteria bacterium]|nr:endonuclease [Spartobacteria bacterium]
MSDFDEAHRLVSELVQDFRAHEHRYLSPEYQEAEARKDFIDKFWKALGWDVDHNIQKNPYEQEVKVERGQDQAGARKRADYAFSLTPNFRDVRFFVKAKKPSVQLENADDYFQTTRYGWNSQNPLAVLTDFEQFHILDCRYKPSIDTALSRAVPSGKFHYTEYLDAEKFARIYWLFAREAVVAGSIEKFAADMPKPRGRAVQRGLFPGGYQSIDEAFLDELDEIRADLALSLIHI